MVESLCGPWEGEAVMREIEDSVDARAKPPERQTHTREECNSMRQNEMCIPAFISGESCAMGPQAVASVLSASVSISVS